MTEKHTPGGLTGKDPADMIAVELQAVVYALREQRDLLMQALREVRFNLYDPEIIEKIATAAISKVEGGAK